MSSPSRGSKLLVAFIAGAVVAALVDGVGWWIAAGGFFILAGAAILVATGVAIERSRVRDGRPEHYTSGPP